MNSGKLREDKVGETGLAAEYKNLCRIAQTCFEQNIGSNKFQQQLESRLLASWSSLNLQDIAQLCKSIVDYKIKDEEFEKEIYRSVD